MASETSSEISGCTFQWKIENISHCWMKNGESIDSLPFTADTLQGTKWFLQLYFIDSTDENEMNVILYRTKDCSGPNYIYINCQLALLDKEGKILMEKNFLNKSSYKDAWCVWENFPRNNIFFTKREAFLPEDTLTIQCKMWKKEGTLVKSKPIYARTVFNVNRSFIWNIDEFSKLKSGIRYKFKDNLIDFDIVLIEGLDFEKKLVVEGISIDDSIKYFSFKSSIVDSEGRNEDCGRHEYFTNDLKKGLLTTLLFTKKFMENKSLYLPNDVLSLDCEFCYSTGTVLYQFLNFGTISPKITKVAVEESNKRSIERESIQLAPVLINDLKSMYSDRIFSDMELRTSTQTFPVHKNILSARSPVFRRIFSNDMKENSRYVNVTDLEDDTVNQMLLYMYTDSLENLELENACKLYAAAEKYEILSLKSMCLSFLRNNLIITKACDVLVLADLYQDEELKSVVQDFILKHHKEVFGSQEWKHFMDSNSKLASEVMFRKVFPG